MFFPCHSAWATALAILCGLAVLVLADFAVDWFYQWIVERSGLVREDKPPQVPLEIIGNFERISAGE
jgi:hypothetical protein